MELPELPFRLIAYTVPILCVLGGIVLAVIGSSAWGIVFFIGVALFALDVIIEVLLKLSQ
jgi:uncharacterized membrane protein